MTVSARRPAPSRTRWLTTVALVLLASLVIGGLESWAQGALPDALSPLANSASGWALVTVLLVHFARITLPWAAPLAVLSMMLLLIGYTVVSGWRGWHYDPTTWLVISVLVGPFVGVAAAWLHEHGVRAALATGALAGVGVGEATYGLVQVAEHTGTAYWTLIAAASAVLVVAMLCTRVKGWGPVAWLLTTTAVVAGALYLVYTTGWV